MRVILPTLQELATDWTIAKDQLKGDLQRAAAAINTSWAKEHTVDGSHGDVVATSLELQGAAVGEWFDLPFAATRFFAEGSAVWTVAEADMNYLKAMRIGQLVVVMFAVRTTGLATDTASSLYIRLPEFHAIATAYGGTALPDQTWVSGVFTWDDISNAVDGMGIAKAVAQPSGDTPQTIIQLDRFGPTNATASSWAISANFGFTGSVMFPVNVNNEPKAYSFV